MTVTKGQIVRSVAGRDKDTFLAVMSADEKGVTVCDGKSRPIERPKLKNPKHIAPTGRFLTEQQMLTNRSVQRGLKAFIRSVEGDE